MRKISMIVFLFALPNLGLANECGNPFFMEPIETTAEGGYLSAKFVCYNVSDQDLHLGGGWRIDPSGSRPILELLPVRLDIVRSGGTKLSNQIIVDGIAGQLPVAAGYFVPVRSAMEESLDREGNVVVRPREAVQGPRMYVLFRVPLRFLRDIETVDQSLGEVRLRIAFDLFRYSKNGVFVKASETYTPAFELPKLDGALNGSIPDLE